MTGARTPTDKFVEAVAREMEWRVDREFGLGAFQELGRSWLAVFLRRPKTREADLKCLAARLARRWRLYTADRRHLRERAGQNGRSPQDEKVELLRIGLREAASMLATYQTMRLGASAWLPEEQCDEWSTDEAGRPIVPRKIAHLPSIRVVLGRGKWVTDERRRQVEIRPDSLSPGVKLVWYASAAIREARAALRRGSEEETPRELVTLPDARRLPDPSASALDTLVAAEEAQKVRRRVARLFEVASPAQEKILAGILKQLNAGRTPAEAKAAVAKTLGIAPATLRVQLRRLTRKAS